MTEKDVIEYLKNRYLVVGSPLNPPREECERHNAVIDMAIKALEKRVPEQPTLEGDWLEELKRYRDLEEKGRLLVLPCRVGDTVYEILEETVPNHYFYISEHKVQDVSVKAVKYADEWEPYDYENLYFTREDAEAALKKRGCEADGD